MGVICTIAAAPNFAGILLVFNRAASPGSFDAPQSLGAFGGAFGRYSNNAPREDYVVSNSNGDVILFAQTSARGFVESGILSSLRTAGPGGDINGDGRDDAGGFVSSGSPVQLQCAAPAAFGTFDPTPVTFGPTSGSFRSSLMTDLNGNGRPDLVLVGSLFLSVTLQ